MIFLLKQLNLRTGAQQNTAQSNADTLSLLVTRVFWGHFHQQQSITPPLEVGRTRGYPWKCCQQPLHPSHEAVTIPLSCCSRPMYSKFRETPYHQLDESHHCYFFSLEATGIKSIFLWNGEISVLWMSTTDLQETIPGWNVFGRWFQRWEASTTIWDAGIPSLGNERQA